MDPLRELDFGELEGMTYDKVAAAVLELPAERVFRLAVDYGSMTRIAWVGDERIVRAVNLTWS